MSAPNSRLSLVILLLMGTAMFAAPSAAQELTFEFRLAVDGASSDWHAFGLRETAVQGIDEFDVPEPPPVPGAAFRSYLAMFSPPPGLPNRWFRDFRPVDGLTLDRVELWQLVLESGALGSTCTVELRSPDPITIPFELYHFGPDAYYARQEVPGSFTFTIDSPVMISFFELRLDDEVADETTAWGGVKALFR